MKMLALALLLVGFTTLQSHALPALVQYQAKDELGQYSYGYSGGPSAKHEERTFDGVTRGSYSYIDGNGLVQTRSYEADDLNGFRVVGTDINAPSGVATSGPAVGANIPLPVSDRSSTFRTYQPVSYLRRGYDAIDTISGNEISFAPVSASYSPPIHKTVTSSVPITSYSSIPQYVKSPYHYRVAPQPVTYATKYVRPHYISTNSLEVSPLSSIGIVSRPTSSYSQPVQAIAYSDSLAAAQSTVTPPTVYSKLPLTATVATPIETVSIQEHAYPYRTSAYQTASSQIVGSYVPKHHSVLQEPVTYASTSPLGFTNQATVTYSRPGVLAYTNSLPSPIAFSDAAPAPVAYTSVTPTAVPYNDVFPTAVTYTKTGPTSATYSDASPSLIYTSASPSNIYTSASPSVSYTSSSPSVSYTSSSPSVAYTSANPSLTYSSATPYFTYGYYPTSSIVRYASEAPSVQATVQVPAGGFTAAKPVPLQETIAAQYHAQDELGQYRYGYSNINSAKEESKTIDGVTRGSFSYVDANGVLQSRSYVSDDVNGFRVIGTDIPKDPNGHVNPDAIPSEHVNVAPVAAAPVPIEVHSQQVVATAVPAQLIAHDNLAVNAPVIVSSTPATIQY